MHVVRAVLLALGVTALVAGFAAAQDGTARLKGVVVNGPTDDPLGNAQVVLGDSLRVATTAADGRFDFGDIPAGTYLLKVRLIGYAPYTFRVRLGAGGTLDVTVPLAGSVAVLPEKEGTADAKADPDGFLERKATANGGLFIDRAEIERRGLPYLTNYFMGIAGTKVDCTVYRDCNVIFTRGAMRCAPTIYVNGMKTMGEAVRTNQIAPGAVEGIEVYRSASEVPAEFAAGGSSCGVILVWTRR